MASVEYKNAMSELRREALKDLPACKSSKTSDNSANYNSDSFGNLASPRSLPSNAESSEKERKVLRKMPAALKSLGPIGKSLSPAKSGMKIGPGLQKKMALKPIGADSKKSKGSGSPGVQQQVAMDGVPQTKSFNAGRINSDDMSSDEEESDEERSSLAEIPDLPAESSSSLDERNKSEILEKEHKDTESKEDLPSPGTPKKTVNLLARKFIEMFDGMVSASNETKHGESPSYTQGGPQTSKPGGSGMSGQISVPGSRGAQGSTASSDDPGNPKRPTPQKLPEDKGDDDLEQEKRQAAKKTLINRMMGHTDILLQNAFHSAAASLVRSKSDEKLRTKNPAQNSSLKPLDAQEASQKEESSQTGEERKVEVLQKKVVSLSNEVTMMQNLVDSCRKDYEQLQSSFNDYSRDFLEVDETRASIRMLKNENAIFKSTQAKASKECLVSKEKIMKYKNKISKMQVDIDFLNAEKVELYKKVKLQGNVSQASSASSALPRTSSSLEALDHLKLEEENRALKQQIEQFEASPVAHKKESMVFKEKLEKQTQKEEELKSKNNNLAAENALLSAKCNKLTKQCDQFSMSEALKELNKTLESLTFAKQQLVSDNTNDVQLQGPTSSPLSVELAEAKEGLSSWVKPEVNRKIELHTISHSITAITEGLMDEISIIKTKLAKANSDNADPITKADGNIEEMNKFKDELDELTETLKDETVRCESFESMVSCTNQQNKQLREEIEELEAELSKTQNELKNTVSYKDRELTNLKRNIAAKDKKNDEIAVELQKIWDKNDALKTVIAGFNNSARNVATKEANLQECIDELESENEKLLDKLSAERKEFHKLQRELHNRQQSSPREDNTHLKNALQSKTDSLIEILDSIDNNELSDSRIRQHPCMVTMHKGMQVLGDITGLVKTLGKACGASREKCPTLDEKSRVEELEQMVGNLTEKTHKLLDEKKRLEQQKKENKLQFSEDTKRGENSMNLDELRNALEKATKALDDRNEQTTEMEDEMGVLKAENDYLESLVAHTRAQAIDDKKCWQDEMTKCQEKIKLLQCDIEKRTANEKRLKEQLSKIENERDQLLVERQALGKKLEVSIQNVKTKGGYGTASITATADRIEKLEEIKQELLQKIEVYKAFSNEQKKEEEENYKDFERATAEIMLLKKHSDEHIEELESRLKVKEMFETQLNNTIKVLEKKCSKLEEEKIESENQIEAMAKSINVESKLEKCKKEWKDLELKLQDKILTLDTETANVQQQLHSQKHELLQVSKRFESRTKELAECLTERNALLEELASLNDKHSEQKEDLKVYMDSLTMDKVKMEEAIREKEKEVVLARQSSFETINDLEKRLKKRQDSELELQEKMRALGEQVIKATAEKLEADQKIKDLSESTHGNQVSENNIKPKNEEERKLQDKLNKLEVTISKLTKEKQEAETLAKNEVLLRDDSEETNYKIIRSLEDKISELKAGSAGIEDNTKAMLEAMNDKKNLEELVKKKNLSEKELTKKLESTKTRLSTVIAAKKKLATDVNTLNYDNILATAKLKTEIEKLEKELEENSERTTEFKDRIKRLERDIEDSRKTLKEREREVELVKKSYEGKIEESEKALIKKETDFELVKKSYEDKIQNTRYVLEEKESKFALAKESYEQKTEHLKKKLTSRLDSDHEIRKKMDLLKQKISSLEAEKLQHNKTISSMIKSLQTKEELSQAIKARSIVDKELKDQLKNMEVIVIKMRKEKTKPHYDQELKARYKAEYYESRDKVRKLSEDMKSYEEQVGKLKGTRKEAAEKSEESSDDVSILEETGVQHLNLQRRENKKIEKYVDTKKEADTTT